MDIINRVSNFHDRMMKLGDPRVESWFLMSSPIPSTIMILMYFIFVYKGPELMRDRKPLDLKPVLILYNFGMVLLSFYIFIEFGLAGWFTGYSLRCEPVDYSYSPKALRMARVSWLFLLTKFIELADTIFFILRKKHVQVTFLHVFHHGFLPINWWIGAKYIPGGFGTFHAMINALVHAVMYLYYGLSALGPSMQKYLWWKKYITSLQITQFVVVVVHTSQIFFINDCAYPRIFAFLVLLYTFCFFILFMDFYRKTYRKSKSEGEIQNAKRINGYIKTN